MRARRKPDDERWEGILGDLEEEAHRRFGSSRSLRRRPFILLRATAVATRLLLARIAERVRRVGPGNRRPRRGGVVPALVADLRHAARAIRRSPVFAVAVVLTVALSAGLNSAVFDLANALLLRDVPARDTDRLGRVVLVDPEGRTRGLSRPLVRTLETQLLPFSSLGAEALLQIAVEGLEGASLLGHAVTDDYFTTLGTRAVVGRRLSPDDARPDAGAVVVTSHRLWRTHLGGREDVIGRPLRLNGRTFTVVGVLEPDFTGTLAAARIDVWVPLGQAEPWLGAADLDSPRAGALSVFARLAPGTSRAGAATALELASEALLEAHAELERFGLRFDEPSLLPAGSRRRSATLFFTALQGLVLLVMLVACANLGNLFLARTTARAREITLRLSLGASRFAVARLLACEALLLSLLGSAAAVVLGAAGASMLLRALPLPSLPLHFDVGPDVRVLAVTLGVGLLAALTVSLAPIATIRRAPLTDPLRSGSAQLAGSSSRLRRVLVTVQVAVSLVLLASGALLVESLRRAGATDPGFRHRRAFALDLELPGDAGLAEAEGRAIYEALLERVRSLPSVEGATLSYLTPLDLGTPHTGIEIGALAAPRGRARIPTSYRVVGDRYFTTLDIRILDGRAFDERDGADGDPVAIVNRTMAERYWPRDSPLGRSFRWGPIDDATAPGHEVRIVGIAGDVKLRTIGEEPTPHFYLPFAQRYEEAMTLVVTTRGSPAGVIEPVQRALADLPQPPRTFFARTLEQQLDFALAPARVAATVAGLLAALALFLSSLGLYGVLSYTVARRRRELGLRMALGAGRAGVARLVVLDGLALVLSGLVAGALLAWPARAALSSLLFGIRPHDPLTLFGGASVLLAAAVLATWLPARRALALSPAEALREQ